MNMDERSESSNEQTVREALALTGLPINISTWLGIDPDMSVSELKRRLRIADRVLELKVEPGVGVTFPGGKLRTSVGMWAVKLRVQQ
jgi:hypothetical protein